MTKLVGASLLGLVIMSGCANQPAKVEREPIDKNGESFALLSDRVKEQDDKIEKLTNSLEELTHQLAKTSKAEALREGASHEARLGTVPVQKLIPGENAEDGVAVPSEAVTPPDEGDIVADSSQETIHWYYDGVRQVRDARYDEAIHSFRKFLEESPEHVYADRSEYWIAESYFRNKEYQLAVLTSNGLESRHPESVRMPDVLMLKAHSYKAMGQKDDAREALRQLLVRFPTNRIADNASRELAELSLEPSSGAKAPVLIDDSQLQ